MNDITKTFTVEQTPLQVFDAINDVRSWWSGQIVGNTAAVGDVWFYLVPDIHFSKQEITESLPGRRIAWSVTDGYLAFVDDKEEWIGTTITFDLTEVDGGTQVVFTHVGLAREVECFEVCDAAWSDYVLGSLRRRIHERTGALMR
ncbi:MAG: SRPBCC domain-containing protein [Pseudolysinimonas sp.]